MRIKEHGRADEVVVATIGPADAQATLRNALAMGAQRALHVVADQPLEPLANARVLLKLVEREQPFLVILGKQAIDDDNNQTGQMLAALWDRPQATFASKLELTDTTARVTREVDAGLETLEVDLPAVVTTDLRLNEPRFVKLPEIMKAKTKPLATHSARRARHRRRSLRVEGDEDRAAPGTPARHHGQGHGLVVCRASQARSRMTQVLVIAEHANGRLNVSTAKCVKAAASLAGAEITVAVFSGGGSPVPAQAAQIAGVTRVLEVTHAANEHQLAATLAPQVAELGKDFTHVFAPSTTFGKDLMPRVAALLDAPQVSDVMSLESATRFRRPIYAGNAITTVEVAARRRSSRPFARPRSKPPRPAVAPRWKQVPYSGALPAHTRFVSLSAAAADRPDLQSASKVISGGRALASADAFKLIYGLADKIGAAVGASRAAVDAGYAPNDMQVGQTGKIIAPELYIAIGISGAIQHLTGIKDARTIVAINKDSEAPIFEVADIGIVGDLFTIVPELEKLIDASTQSSARQRFARM